MLLKKTLIFGCIILCFVQAVSAQTKNALKTQCSSLASKIVSIQEIKQVYLKTIDNSLSNLNSSSSEEKDVFFDLEIMNKADSMENISLEEMQIIEAKLPEIKNKTVYAFKQRLKNSLPLETWFDNSVNARCPTLFSLAEIKKLNLFFQNDKGTKIAQILNKTIIFALNKEEMHFSKDEKLFLPAVDKFVDARLGQKIFKSLIAKGVIKDLEKSFKDWLEIQPSAFETEVPEILREILAAGKSKD